MDRTLLIRAACAVRDTMIANQDYLTSLDQQNGDGDLGVSMVQGYSAVARYLESVEEEDLGRLFMKAASVFNEAAPSTLGTITSFFLMGMARALKGKREASLEDMAVACEVGLAL
jgi:dihydroxyacetone kinase-like predicted kinase